MRKFVQNRWVWLTIRLLLGCLFMLTSIPKVSDVNGFIELVNGYGILPVGLARLAGSVLPWIELYIGTALLLGVLVRITSVLIIPMALTFGFGGIYAMVKSSGIICGCFGSLIQISHPVSLTIDGIMLILSFILATQKDKNFLTLAGLIDKNKPDFRSQRNMFYWLSQLAIILMIMAVITGVVYVVK